MGKRTAEAEPEAVEPEEVETDEEDTKSSKSAVTVTWRGGTREFSEALHGTNFKKVAEQFAEKFNGTVA